VENRERATQLEYKPCAVRTSRGKIVEVNYTIRCQCGVYLYNKVNYITAQPLLYESGTFTNVVITLCLTWPSSTGLEFLRGRVALSGVRGVVARKRGADFGWPKAACRRLTL
jgi:hypothetical protein